jgi:hypothetical protein
LWCLVCILSQDGKAWPDLFLVYLEGTLSRGICRWIVVEFCGALYVHVLTFVTIYQVSFPFFFTLGLVGSLEHNLFLCPLWPPPFWCFCTSGFDLGLFSLYFLPPFFTGCFV